MGFMGGVVTRQKSSGAVEYGRTAAAGEHEFAEAASRLTSGRPEVAKRGAQLRLVRAQFGAKADSPRRKAHLLQRSNG
jgi:hypothetical protein